MPHGCAGSALQDALEKGAGMNQVQTRWQPDLTEAQPENLEDLRSTFIRNVEHELRTPLAVMLGYAELLQHGDLGALAPEQQKAMFVIVDRAAEMRMLVERIGVLLEAETHPDTMVPLALDRLVAEVVKDKLPAAARAKLQLDFHLQPDMPPVPGNPRLVRQALACLLENAIKFTPAGRIEVQTYTEPGWACMAVSDTGIGIPADKLPHLFNGFYQADGSTTRKYSGIGLGLTVVKAVAQTHQGQIHVESQPGQGSRFTFKLPLSPAPETVQPAKGMTPRRILVVDDEESVAATLRHGLERLPNCQVAVATSGEQALQLFAQQPFDLLITDYKMPGMDGLTLARHVRQSYPATEILMLTAYSSDDLHAQAESTSIRRVLDKPAKLSELRSAVAEVLKT